MGGWSASKIIGIWIFAGAILLICIPVSANDDGHVRLIVVTVWAAVSAVAAVLAMVYDHKRGGL